MNKQAVFDNVEEYSAEQLAQYINDGEFTFEELCNKTEGDLSPRKRKEVKLALGESQNQEEKDWELANSSQKIELIQKYLDTYPFGKYRAEAIKLRDSLPKPEPPKPSNPTSPKDPRRGGLKILLRKINEIPTFKNKEYDGKIVEDVNETIFQVIVDFINKQQVTKEQLLNIIDDDQNALSSGVIKKLIAQNVFAIDDIYKLNVDDEFVDFLFDQKKPQEFKKPDPIDRINKQSTEVYFWGIPSSGKSCALGAILSVANSGAVANSMIPDPDCQGYGYMNRLSSLFRSKNSIGILPAGTPTCSTYEMAFDLQDYEGLVHPITCIDLAGELVRCMFKNDAQEDMREEEVVALDTVTKILHDKRTSNRKIHFFVLEYGAENREYEGLTQTEYLRSALAFIKRYHVFESDTDAIYLLVTKVDKTKLVGKELGAELARYIEDYYKGFYGALKTICSDYEINNGNVEIVPFSLGTVCFQDYCKFDPAAAKNVVIKILKRAKGFKTGKISRISNALKK